MPLSVASVLPGRAGKIIFVCAMSSVCAAYFLSHRQAGQPNDPDVSLRSKDADARAVPAASTPATPAPASAPVPKAPAFTVKNARIDHSFAAAAQSVGVDAATTAMLARAFHGDIDFSRDLRQGDRVSFVFGNDSPIDATQIAATDAASKVPENSGQSTAQSVAQNPGKEEPLAVRVTRGTTSHDVFLYKDLSGKPFYYSKDGASTKPVFSRYPLDFTRVSSPFSLRRLDPVTHVWQSHDGVDLAAPTGTPVHATAKGVIRFVGRQTGYGKVVVIQNPAPYSTTFAHLSRFAKGLHRGSRVNRGQVIGYVGETGWATGPHLHYELHVRHVPENPLTVALPQTDRLRTAELDRFKARAAQLTALLSDS